MRKLSINCVSYSWHARQGDIPAITNLSFEFQSGVPYFFCGRSGSGKTTLGLLCAGLLKPDSGSIQSIPESTAKSDIAMVFQFPETLFIEDTVRGEFESIHGALANKTATQWMSALGLDYSLLAGRLPFKLSSAEGRMTAIALQLSREPSLLVLDEPTVGLDSFHRKRLIDCLKHWMTTQRIMIVISHDLTLMRSLGGNTIILKEGRVDLQIETEMLMNNKSLLRQYDLT